MGLSLAVGLLADETRAGQDGDVEFLHEQLDRLNDVLKRVGLPPHREPADIAVVETFSADLIGYGGLHMVRRLAAHWALKGALPPPVPYSTEEDSMVSAYYQKNRSYAEKPSRGLLARLFGTKLARPEKPAFRHLMFHSDSEGYYVPLPFEDVIFEHEQHDDGLGGMVGSSHGLLGECLELASLISLPADFDPEGHDIEAATNGLGDYECADGLVWKSYPTEAYCLGQLILGCRASIKNKAVLTFC